MQNTIPFVGSVEVNGVIRHSGFMPFQGALGHGNPYAQAQILASQTPEIARGELSAETREVLDKIQRGAFDGNISEFANQMAMELESMRQDVARAIVSTQTGLPVRENLEAPAIILVPTDTPLRNRLARVMGSGLATSWRQITALGGGWGSGYDQGGGGSATRAFYNPDSGAPSEYTTTYAAKSATYKALGAMGKVSMLAAAGGATYGDLQRVERNNCLANMMLNEENALINGDSTSTAAPWGDGSNALAFDGVIALTATGNGTPSAQVQTSVGAFTLEHFNAQLTRLWKQGARGLYVVMNSQEIISLQAALRDANEPYRLNVVDQANATLGFRISKYVHPVSGEIVDIIPDRFMPAGTIFYAGTSIPDGSPVLDVEVLPQAPLPSDVQRPEGTNQDIQGYAVTELARTLTTPDLVPFMISVYEVLRLKSALHVAKSTGVTAYVPSSGSGSGS